jgi:hypothetical protein
MDLLDIVTANNGFTFISPLGTPRKIREVVIATTVALTAAVQITSIAATAVPSGATVTVGATPLTVGQSATVNSGSISLSCDTVGSYRLILTFNSGQQRDLLLFGVESAAITNLVAQTPIVRAPLTLEQQTLIMRSLVNEGTSWFSGAASSLAGHSLVPFGA